MRNTLRLAIVLLTLGLVFAGASFLISTPEASYSVDAHAIDDPGQGATAVTLANVDPGVRDEIHRAIESTSRVEVGTHSPDVPGYVDHEGQVYSISLIVADPGGGAALAKLASMGAGVLCLAVGLLVGVVALWRRHAARPRVRT